MTWHKASQNTLMKLQTIIVSNNNAIPIPRPHDNVVKKTELICHKKDGTHR